MHSTKTIRNFVTPGMLVLFLCGLAGADSRQSTGQEAPSKRKTAPIYATGKDGAPAAALTTADLEVKLGGNPVEDFTLTKGGSERKLIFLVFDTSSMSSNLLSKSKKIAESCVSSADPNVRFVVMGIDPGAGLRPICGPTTDKAVVTKNINKSVIAKSGSYFQSRSDQGTGILDALPDYRSKTPVGMARKEQQLDDRQDRQVATIILTSLRTLNDVLSRFPDSDKIVHFYSSGIPTGATQDRTSIDASTPDTRAPSQLENSSPDRVTYDLIKSSGQSFKKNGALLFAVNLGGTRIGEANAASGEQSLRMLVNESSGRYFKGTDKDIIQSLNAIEQGYYELSLPVSQEIQDSGIGLDVRSKNPDITLSTVSVLGHGRRFSEMTPQEKQGIILSILSNGLVGDVGLKISAIPVDVAGAGDEALLTVQLPPGPSPSEWDIYKVWRDPGKGDFQIEKEHVMSESPVLTFSMANRENTLQDAVLVQAKTGTVLICQGKQKPKS